LRLSEPKALYIKIQHQLALLVDGDLDENTFCIRELASDVAVAWNEEDPGLAGLGRLNH